MKTNKLLFWFVVIATVVLLAFRHYSNAGGSITGTVRPLTAVSRIYVITGKDSIPAVLEGTRFTISNLRTGSYTLNVETMAPFKPWFRDNIPVNEGVNTEVGEVVLVQQP